MMQEGVPGGCESRQTLLVEGGYFGLRRYVQRLVY